MTVEDFYKTATGPFKVLLNGDTKWVVGSFFAGSSAMISEDPRVFDPCQIIGWEKLELADGC